MGMNDSDRFLNDIRGQGYSAQEAAEMIGISVEKLLHWQSFGIVRPRHVRRGEQKIKEYFEEDIRNATVIRLFMDRGYSLERAVKRLKELS